mgnify:CR=1 FL=1
MGQTRAKEQLFLLFNRKDGPVDYIRDIPERLLEMPEDEELDFDRSVEGSKGALKDIAANSLPNPSKLHPMKYNNETQLWERAENHHRLKSIVADQMKVLTYNICQSRDYTTIRHEKLLDILEKSNADVISLQEVKPNFLHQLTATDWVKRRYFTTDVKGLSSE